MGQNERPETRKRRRDTKRKESLASRVLRIWLGCIVFAVLCLAVLVVVRVVIPVTGMYREATQLVSKSDVSTFR